MSDPKEAAQGAATPPVRSIVDEGTRFKGVLSSTCPILVQGTVEGEVHGPALTVSATGVVSGTIVTGTLKSAGSIAGSFDVETAQLAGTVAPKTVVKASSVHLKLNAQDGRLEVQFERGSESK